MSTNFVSGLVSGIDTSSLIDALVTSRSGPVVLLQRRQAEKTAQLSAWKSLEAILISLKVETDHLGKASLWNTPGVTTSDEDALTATAASNAALGSWDFHVAALAQSHQLQSVAFGSREELVGSGTLSITVGSGTTDVTVAAGTSLADLADQINEADLGASATIVRSDDGSAESYYLVLTADETGVANAMSVASSLTGGTDPVLGTEIRAAANAVLELGGAGGLAIESATNTFEDILQGVDVTVHTSGVDVSLSVARDTEGLEDAVATFVDRYNSLISYVNQQFHFDPEVGDRPPLMGSGTLTSIASDLRSAVTGPVSGLGGDIRTLFAVGVRSGADGTLTFDRGDFQDALAADFEGVANLFRASASFDTEGVEWLSAPDGVVLADREVRVEVTQAAERAQLAGSAFAIGGGVTIDGTNDAFRIEVDGRASEVLHVAQGTYATHADLAAAIQAAVDGSSSLGELTVAVSAQDAGGGSGSIVLTSRLYGADHSIQLTSAGASTFASATGLASAFNTLAEGVDVEGTIGGIAAEGSGQTLRLANDVEDIGGLSFLVTADAPGTFTASFTEGIGRSASRRLFDLTDATDGRLSRVGDSIQRVIDRIDRDIAAKQEQLDRYRERLIRRYARLESTLGELQNQGAFISAQIAAANSGGFGFNNNNS